MSATSDLLRQVAVLFATPEFQKVLPVVMETVKKIEASPSLLQSPTVGAQFVVDLAAALPGIDSDTLQASADLFGGLSRAVANSIASSKVPDADLPVLTDVIQA